MSDLSRSNLPIPHRAHVGLTTYDAKDPDTSYPAIEPSGLRLVLPTWSSS
jgi:hypothetical protein